MESRPRLEMQRRRLLGAMSESMQVHGLPKQTQLIREATCQLGVANHSVSQFPLEKTGRAVFILGTSPLVIPRSYLLSAFQLRVLLLRGSYRPVARQDVGRNIG